MANIGEFNTLEIVAITDQGCYVDGNDLGEILLPKRFTPSACQIGDTLDVFLYFNSADHPVATTEQPLVRVNEFASLKVKQVNKIGAFLDWGLPKDLLVPFSQQHTRMEVGKYYLVYVFLEQASQRLVASSKLDKFIDIWPPTYQRWDKVDLIIAKKTDLGFKAIINHKHWGLLYDNEIFKPLKIGQQLTGYVKQVRADERIDLSLTRAGEGKVKDFREILLAHLAQNNGYSPLHDKSDPELIKRVLGVSKKVFKSTVGHLLKQGKIKIEQNGIRLV